MKKIEDENLENIKGGSVAIFGIFCLAITTLSVLVSGIIEGYVHPRGCNE